MNELAIGITCVGYSDFLQLTLPQTLRYLGTPWILTAGSDDETKRCGERHGVPVYATEAWFDDGSPFNKARGLNSWLDSLDSRRTSWVLTLDADIVVPPSLIGDLTQLNRNYLYGVPRRVCAQKRAWNDFVTGSREWTSFELDVPRIKNGKLWGLHDTTNAAAVYGYFQLWHVAGAVGARRFVSCPTAALYDVLFALSFGDSHRINLPRQEVLHVGPIRENWSGRTSEKWADAAAIPPNRIYQLHR